MKTTIYCLAYCLVELAFAVCAPAQSSSFTYQGRLTTNGAPFTGFAEMNFVLFDAATEGSAVATNMPAPSSVDVSNGLFATSLNFGAGVFDGADRFLEIQIRTNNGAFVTLAPRQQLSPVPTAIFAQEAGRLNGTISVTQLPANVVTNGANISGTFTGDGSQITGVDALTLDGLGTEGFWKSRGNGGTIPGTDFLGTTDNQPLEFKVGGLRALRLEPNPPGSPNVIGGSAFNYVSNSVVGATIAGGGETFVQNFTNVVTANFGTVSGGTGNRAAFVATVGGGTANVAGFDAATVSGGFNNAASGHASAIGGGGQNAVSGGEATIGGGFTNTATADFSTVGGGFSNFAGGNSATVAGGFNNTAGVDAATVGGGGGNSASGIYATVSGGNNNVASGAYAMVPGGHANIASGDFSFAGGNDAQALHQGAFVWADDFGGIFSSTANDQFSVRARGGVRLDGNVQIGEGGGDYRYLRLGGGNSSGFLYGSFPKFGDGIHLSYNYYADGSGGNHIVNSGGATSRLTVGYGYVGLYVGSLNSAPSTQRLYVSAAGVTVNGTFNNSSDRNAKQDFEEISASDILDKVLALPVSEWSYKEDSETRHIGPVAQDFHSIFNIGTDDRHIAPTDEGGIAFAAIQGLNRKLETRNQKSEIKIQKLEAENAELRRRLDALERAILNPGTQ